MRCARHILWLVGLLTAAAGLAYHTTAEGARQVAAPRPESVPPRNALPLSQVMLFNSGVGYFQREGTVEGDTRVDLALPADDINDLLKSLVIEDPEHQGAGAVSYDSHEPIERSLSAFALDLTGNPTFGQLLNQARGEKVEVSVLDSGVASTLTGQIVGMESQTDGTGKETHLLNLLGSDGLRSIALTHVQRIRFLNPALDAELDGALRLLAAARDTKKKMVHFDFKGAAKHSVRVGYVAESPMWKTTYRLIFDKDGKPRLQSWAIVENTTDEDWKDVRLSLISGRPLSFTMDLYQPLYVPRPRIEPELFASLRPPAYNGALVTGGGLQVGAVGGVGVQLGGHGGLGAGGLGALGAVGVQLGALGVAGLPSNGVQVGANLGVVGGQTGQFGNLGAYNRYQTGGLQGGAARAANASDDENPAPAKRLTYEELQQRREAQKKVRQEAKQVASALAAVDPKENLEEDSTDVASDAFRRILDQKVTLPRQKSALVQILDKEVKGKRVSIFNEAVHNRVPLLGLKFKNTTGQPLMQGPLMVYDDGRYAGDARILDLQPDEERLLAFALDQGVEVKTFDTLSAGLRVTLRTLQNDLQVQYTLRKTRSYVMRNRSSTDRQMVIEHPAATGWKLAAESKPAERTRDLYRFEVDVPAGKTTKFDVAVEQEYTEPFRSADKAFSEEHQLVRHFAAGTTGVEVDQVSRPASVELLGLKVIGGEAISSYRRLESLTYRLRNVSRPEREVTLEYQAAADHALLGDVKPIAGSTDRYAFALKVSPGSVVEQKLQDLGQIKRTIKLTDIDDEYARPLLVSTAVSDTGKAVLREALRLRSELQKKRMSAEEGRLGLKAIVDEQERLRANLERLPPASAAYKRYLEKFDTQETQIEKLQAQIDAADKAMRALQREINDFASKATAD
jgi:hypothetical protein